MKKVKLSLAGAGLVYKIEAEDIYKEKNIKKEIPSEYSMEFSKESKNTNTDLKGNKIGTDSNTRNTKSGQRS